MSFKIKRKDRATREEDEQMVDDWIERVEEGLGRKLTAKEKAKERRLMI